MNMMKKIVIKVGTSALTQGTQQLSRRSMLYLAQQIAELSGQGLEIALVSSGAVATGKGLFNHNASKQTLASIGQVRLMQSWAELFALFDLQIGQLLFSKEDFLETKELLTKETIRSLIRHKTIPVINEHDSVATEATALGNNDWLAALVAKLIGADTLILLTDQEGLFTTDPRHDPEAKLIPLVEAADEAVYVLAKGSSSSLGTGGMAAKMDAARIASAHGTQTVIASYRHPNVLIELASGKNIGTLVKAGRS